MYRRNSTRRNSCQTSTPMLTNRKVGSSYPNSAHPPHQHHHHPHHRRRRSSVDVRYNMNAPDYGGGDFYGNPPIPPPPPPPGQGVWDLQYSKWMGWNWIRRSNDSRSRKRPLRFLCCGRSESEEDCRPPSAPFPYVNSCSVASGGGGNGGGGCCCCCCNCCCCNYAPPPPQSYVNNGCYCGNGMSTQCSDVMSVPPPPPCEPPEPPRHFATCNCDTQTEPNQPYHRTAETFMGMENNLSGSYLRSDHCYTSNNNSNNGYYNNYTNNGRGCRCSAYPAHHPPPIHSNRGMRCCPCCPCHSAPPVTCVNRVQLSNPLLKTSQFDNLLKLNQLKTSKFLNANTERFQFLRNMQQGDQEHRSLLLSVCEALLNNSKSGRTDISADRLATCNSRVRIMCENTHSSNCNEKIGGSRQVTDDNSCTDGNHVKFDRLVDNTIGIEDGRKQSKCQCQTVGTKTNNNSSGGSALILDNTSPPRFTKID